MEKTEGESDKKYGVNRVYFHYLLKKNVNTICKSIIALVFL